MTSSISAHQSWPLTTGKFPPASPCSSSGSTPAVQSEVSSRETSPKRVRIHDAGEALALVEHLYGGLVQDSLLVVGFYHGEVGPFLRVPLARSLESPLRAAQHLGKTLSGGPIDPGPEAVMIVTLASEAQDTDSQKGIDQLRETTQLVLDGEFCLEIVQWWHVEAGMVRHVPLVSVPADGEDHTAVPVARVLHETSANVLLPRTANRSNPQEIIDRFNTPPSWLPRGIAKDLGKIRLKQYGLRHENLDHAVELNVWDHAISTVARHGEASTLHDAHELARLAQSLETPTLRERVMAIAAIGEADKRDDAEAVLLGASSEAPHWSRIDALARILHALSHIGDHAVRRAAMSVLMWVEWAKGRGSVAGAYYDLYHEDYSGCGLVTRLGSLINDGHVCGWALVKEHSWSWWQRSVRPCDDVPEETSAL